MRTCDRQWFGGSFALSNATEQVTEWETGTQVSRSLVLGFGFLVHVLRVSGKTAGLGFWVSETED